MRVSDRETARNYLKYLEKAKSNYADTNEKIASGSRFTRISEDVSAGTKALRVRTDMSRAEEYSDNVKAVNEQMTTTENAMTSINDILTQAHAKVLKALNAPTGESGATAIANEIGAMREEILQFANTKYNDMFVLGGASAGSAPFSTDSSGNLLYNGIDVNTISKKADGSYCYNDGSGTPKDVPMDSAVYVDVGLGITMTGSTVKSDTAMKVSYSGLDILGFGKDADGNPQNVYNMLTKMKDNISNSETLGKYDKKLVAFSSTFKGYLTDIGSKTSFLDTIENRIDKSIDTYKSQINRLVGINDAEEATNQSMNDYVLKAVLSMGSKILPTSLMDFIR